MSSSSSSTNDDDYSYEDEHEQLQRDRTNPAYARARELALEKYFAWYDDNHLKYKVFNKPRTTNWKICPLKWKNMMDKFKGKGNALFDYVLFARRNYHGRNKQGMGHFRDVRSAILNLLEEARFGCYTTQGATNMRDFWTGLRKQNHDWVTETGIDDSAKVAFPFPVYEKIAKSMLKQGKIKEWAYLILQWNLMSRKCNIGDIHFNFVHWQGDMMTILFCHSKTQKGSRKNADKFHLSSNPQAPWICPITAVALLLMVTSHDGKTLFESADAAAAYTRAFDAALLDPCVIEAMRKAGVRSEDVASHSIRKSAATYAAGGTTAPPAVFSILLRGGWSIGDILSRYIKVAEDQDRFLAHILVGRNILDKTFTILPPHFVTSPSDEVLKTGFVGQWMESQFEELKGVLHLLTASAVSGIDLLRTETRVVTENVGGVISKTSKIFPLIPSTHPIFSNDLLHGATHRQLKNMLAKGDAQYNSSIMTCSGVPPWAYLKIQVDELVTEQKVMVKILKELKEAAQNGGK